jgi:15-cis-phytoene synthase
MADAEQEAESGEVTRDLVRRLDQDRYWSALQAPKAAQEGVFALYAFNVELSRISLQVSEAMFGEVRLRWWRDFVELAAEGGIRAKTGNPVADALAGALQTYSLSDELLTAMIDARVFDLNRDPMPDMEALRNYLGATSASLFALTCQVLGVKGEQVEKAASHAGMAWGLTGLMRNLPVHSTRGQIFLPASHMAAHGVALRSLTRGEETENLGPALKSLRRSARQSLELFRREALGLPREVAPAFLHLALVEPYLQKLANLELRPLGEVAEVNPLRRYWRIVRAAARGRV